LISALRGFDANGCALKSALQVEAAIVVVLAMLRLGTVPLVAVSAWAWRGLGVSPAAWVVMYVAVGWSVAYFAAIIYRGSFSALSWWWGAVDVAVAVAALVVSGLVLPRDWWIGTWLVWAPGYVNPVVATIPAWLRSVPRSLAVGSPVAVLYAAFAWPGNQTEATAVINNTLCYVLFVLTSAMLGRTVRQLGERADASQACAVELATDLELASYRFHVHNATGLLARLAQDNNPEELLPSLRAQAAREANRLRNEILNARQRSISNNVPPPPVDLTLNAVVGRSVAGFGQLPLDVRTALSRGVQLEDGEAVAVETALVSLLYNVQFHARAHEVVIHTDVREGLWEVSVADDGIGFDPDKVEYKFGLTSQVIDSARRNGLTVSIESRPGEGTCVTIGGRVSAPANNGERLRR
jgi:signal transduction histidine kinase